MNQSFISIIVPVYNKALFLPQCFDCLRKQTIGFENLQVIFCDDCSTDESFSLLQQFAAEHKNVLVLQTPHNSGFAGAPRNLALKEAEAPYLMFLDADDTFTPNACRALYDAAVATQADLVTGCYQLVENSGTTPCERSFLPEDFIRHLFRFPDELPRYLDRVRDSFWCKIYRTALVHEHQVCFLNGVPAEDIYFLYKYLLHCKSGAYVPTHIYNYTIDCDGVTQNLNAAYFFGIANGYRQIFELFAAENQMALFRIISQQVLEFHMQNMITSAAVTAKDLLCVLPEWSWFFKYEAAQDALRQMPYAQVAAPLILAQDYVNAAKVLAALRPVLEENLRLREHAVALAAQNSAITNSFSWKLMQHISRILKR